MRKYSEKPTVQSFEIGNSRNEAWGITTLLIPHRS